MELGTVQEAEAIFADPRLLNPRKSYECVAERVILPYVGPLYHMVRERQSANTVVAASGFCFGALIAREKLGVPVATIHLQPSMIRSLTDGGSPEAGVSMQSRESFSGARCSGHSISSALTA